MKPSDKKELVLVLENIRSMHNVGSLFRTADAMGVSNILLVGYTPQPTDRFGRVVKEIQKTSLGAAQTVPWEHVADIQAALNEYKSQGYTVVVVEQDARSVPLQDVTTTDKMVVVLGNEVDGVSDTTRAQADIIAEIPMHGQKESLNVSVAGGIALWHLQGRRC